jgi:hypothetical protein
MRRRSGSHQSGVQTERLVRTALNYFPARSERAFESDLEGVEGAVPCVARRRRPLPSGVSEVRQASIAEAVADDWNDAHPDRRARPHGLDGVRQTLSPVAHAHEDVIDRRDSGAREPSASPLAAATDSDTENLPRALDGDSRSGTDGPVGRWSWSPVRRRLWRRGPSDPDGALCEPGNELVGDAAGVGADQSGPAAAVTPRGLPAVGVDQPTGCDLVAAVSARVLDSLHRRSGRSSRYR